jgi:hypothetical protein
MNKKRKRTKAVLVTSSDTHNRLIFESNPGFETWFKGTVTSLTGINPRKEELLAGSWKK